MAEDAIAPAELSQVNGSIGPDRSTTNPYETDPELIPPTDLFLSRSPQYGRYAPHVDDFKPSYDGWYQAEPGVSSYWEEVVRTSCTPENSLSVPGTREVYAAGSVLIKVDQEPAAGAAAERYSNVNTNELSAAKRAQDALQELGVVTPIIYFCGTVDGKNVTVESRIPGVSLEVAWKYLTIEQIGAFKQQCRRIIQRLAITEPAPESASYVCGELNAQSPPGVEDSERDILFQDRKGTEQLYLVHNDMIRSNIVVKDGRIVGILGWRQCGFFGFERAKQIHRQFRIPERPVIENGGVNVTQVWADLYDDIPDVGVTNGLPDHSTTAAPEVKIEPLQGSLDKYPPSNETEILPALAQLDGTLLPEEHPTPRKVADLKSELASRASSTDRSSPSGSIKAAGRRKSGPGASKKGTAKKQPTKKRKIDELASEDVGSRRSNTPSSTRASKTPGVKKQGSVSVAGSPAPEGKKRKKNAKKAKVEKHEEEEEQEEDSSEDDGVFCICRKGDDHTWMIACDGGCDDWFHGKCINIDTKDADLIDKYICPNCKEEGKGWTTWKPMCRLKGCRKPARVTGKNPSKYCSDEHGQEFMRRRIQQLHKTPEDPAKKEWEELGSRGGVLTTGDLHAVVMAVSSAEEFRKLGERIISPPPDEEDPVTGARSSKKLGLDVDPEGLTYSHDEASKLEQLRKQRDELLHRRDMLNTRSTFMTLIRQRSKSIVEKLKQTDPKGGWKDICGFDTRLAWSDEEFDDWRLSKLGAKALEEGTPEALASSYPDAVDADGDTAMNGTKTEGEEEDELAKLSRGVCTKKRCERHKQWVKVHQSELLFEENKLKQDLATCEREAQNVVERAVLRMWAEKENAQNGGE
ncbi:set1 complex component spp1 [Aspergillus udagawae]|uniref:Set1 complex component spp1 n=1 Tax=Aspergillus udagawae TaxID=91492 RepID=A0A8H3S4R0_9EURO|nr:set1 complex component spp1 [Aspergillus udagawae]